MASAKAPARVEFSPPSGGAEEAPSCDRGNYTQIFEEAVLIPPEVLDAPAPPRTATEIVAAQEAALNHAFDLEITTLGMKQSGMAAQQQALMNQQMQAQQQMGNLDDYMKQVMGIGEDPLQGVPDRTVPYWKAMYGNLGMGGGHFRGGK